MHEGLADLLLRHRLARPIALAVNALLALLVLWLVARLAWLALGFGVAATPLPAVADTLAAPLAPAEPLARWHLFGNALPSQDPRALADAAPDTSLKLTLRGIVAQDDPKTGYAIIAGADGREQSYTVGGELPDGVRVDAIYADRVLLLRDGALETLRLPRRDESAAAAPANPLADTGRIPGAAGNPTNTAPAPSGAYTSAPAFPANTIDWNAATEKLGVDARELAKQVQVLPVVENGQFVGVRLSAGADHPAIAGLGLKPDDIVTSVNGIPLDNFSRAQAIQDSLATAKTVNVTVRRGDKTENLSVSVQ